MWLQTKNTRIVSISCFFVARNNSLIQNATTCRFPFAECNFRLRGETTFFEEFHSINSWSLYSSRFCQKTSRNRCLEPSIFNFDTGPIYGCTSVHWIVNSILDQFMGHSKSIRTENYHDLLMRKKVVYWKIYIALAIYRILYGSNG